MFLSLAKNGRSHTSPSWFQTKAAIISRYYSTRSNKKRVQLGSLRKSLRSGSLWQTRGLSRPAPTELLLIQKLKKLFPDEEIYLKRRKQLNVKMPGSQMPLEIDVSIPRLRFHVEFQDPYHYVTVWYSSRPLASVQAMDNRKKHVLEVERGETLLQLPCWWDGEEDSLVASIKAKRPDLLPHITAASPPVSDTPPENFFTPEYEVPDFGELMKAATQTRSTFEVGESEWMLGEKYDGMHCFWHKDHREFYSRFGNKLTIPEEFKQLMPDEFVEGEIYFGRGQYYEAAKLRSSNKQNVNWKAMRIMAFDVPNPTYINNKTPYKERYGILQSIIPPEHPFLKVAPRLYVNKANKDIIPELIDDIIRSNGEGAIMYKMDSPYICGCSNDVVKIKPARDCEALVISSSKMKVQLQLPDGTEFSVRASQVVVPLKKGDIVTFSFKRYVYGSTLPDKPVFHRVRTDVDWDEVVASVNSRAYGTDLRGQNYKERWNGKTDEEIRGLFEQYAEVHNFDPLVAENWYKIKTTDILEGVPGASHTLMRFDRNVKRALIALFPEIEFDESKFQRVSQRHWKSKKNAREWFEKFARSRGADPNDADFWYKIRRKDLLSTKGAGSILKYNNYSYIEALVEAFGLDESKFGSPVPRNHWKEDKNVRAWLENCAKAKGFDPLVPSNWYNITQLDIRAMGGRGILNEPFAAAVLKAYPDIGLDKSKFRRVGQHRSPSLNE